jgi:hypothetical protein
MNASPETISEAVAWLSQQSPAPSPIIPTLQKRFGLSAKEAIDVTRQAATRKGATE